MRLLHDSRTRRPNAAAESRADGRPGRPNCRTDPCTDPSAVIAGLVASILSQPGDTLLTLYNSRRAPDGDAASVAGMAREIIAASGPAGLFRGWKPRLAHTASIVVVQLAAYDYLKSALA